jgi:hypothetical protein
MFGASTTFMNRDTESVVALTPNIGLTYQLTSRHSGVRIDATLNLCQSFLMAQDHLSYGDETTDHDGGDRYEEDS